MWNECGEFHKKTRFITVNKRWPKSSSDMLIQLSIGLELWNAALVPVFLCARLYPLISQNASEKSPWVACMVVCDIVLFLAPSLLYRICLCSKTNQSLVVRLDTWPLKKTRREKTEQRGWASRVTNSVNRPKEAKASTAFPMHQFRSAEQETGYIARENSGGMTAGTDKSRASKGAHQHPTAWADEWQSAGKQLLIILWASLSLVEIWFIAVWPLYCLN